MSELATMPRLDMTSTEASSLDQHCLTLSCYWEPVSESSRRDPSQQETERSYHLILWHSPMIKKNCDNSVIVWICFQPKLAGRGERDRERDEEFCHVFTHGFCLFILGVMHALMMSSTVLVTCLLYFAFILCSIDYMHNVPLLYWIFFFNKSMSAEDWIKYELLKKILLII